MVATSSDCDAVGGGSHRLDGLAGGEEMLRTLYFLSYVGNCQCVRSCGLFI